MGVTPILRVQPRRPTTPSLVEAARLSVVREYYAVWGCDMEDLEAMVLQVLAGEAPTYKGQPLPNDTPFGIPEMGGLPAASQFPRPQMDAVGEPRNPGKRSTR